MLSFGSFLAFIPAISRKFPWAKSQDLNKSGLGPSHNFAGAPILVQHDYREVSCGFADCRGKPVRASSEDVATVIAISLKDGQPCEFLYNLSTQDRRREEYLLLL